MSTPGLLATRLAGMLVVPAILDGRSPVSVALVGAMAIMLASL